MATDKMPHLWTGQTVHVGLLVPTEGTAPASATYKTGRLDLVNDHGILGAFADEADGEEPMRSFYPWAAVLQIASVEEVADVIGIR